MILKSQQNRIELVTRPGYDQEEMMVGHEDEDGVVHAGNVDGSYDVNEAE